MCKSSRGDSDRPVVRDASTDATSQSMVNMSDPLEVRRLIASRNSQEKQASQYAGELNFVNPYGDSQSQGWHPGDTNSAMETQSVDQTGEQSVDQTRNLAGDLAWDQSREQTGDQVSNTASFQPGDQSTISELTAISEAKLPVHANGSYPNPDEWEGLHSKMVQRAEQAAKNGSKLVFYGDSITEAMGYNPDALGAFQKDFAKENPTPLAIGGDGTQQLLYRINHGELQGEPKVAVVMIGTNDIGSLSTEQIKENTSQIIDSIQARSPNTKVLLMGALPRPIAGDPGNVKVNATNKAISQLATPDGAVQFADINDNFLDANGNEVSSLYQPDGLHLSNAGYQMWADSIKNQLANMLNAPDVRRNNPPQSEFPQSEFPQSETPQYYPPQYSEPQHDELQFGESQYDVPQSYPQQSYPQQNYPQQVYTPPSSAPQYEPPQSLKPSYPNYEYGAASPQDEVSPVPLPSPDFQPAGEGISLDVGAIRGVNLDGAEWQKWRANENEFWPTIQELDYFKSKGMNTVRLPISWEQFQPTLNGPLDQNEMTQLHIFLEAAEARGIKVILSLQNFNRYNLNHGPQGQGGNPDVAGTLVGDPGVPVSAFQDFWARMARDVNEDPEESAAIGGWDLMNEPFNTNGTWVGTATAAVQAIRATGDKHAVVIEGDAWARDFSGFEQLAKSDQNVVFSAHTYWDSGSGAYPDKNPPPNTNIGVEKIKPFVDWLKQNDAEGFVGEWGVPTNNPAWNPHITNFITYLNQNGVGNLVWAAGPGWKDDYTLSVEPVNGQDRPIMPAIEAANRSAS